MRKAIVLVVGIALLAGANYVILERERLLDEGRVVLLELAPVDPRSLMQGDYMALRFAVANQAFGGFGQGSRLEDGRIVLSVDARGVGSFVRFDDGAPLEAGQVRMRYRVRDDAVKFATNAFFFEEGQASRYESARYGEFRVADNGVALLTELRDAQLRPMTEK